MKRLCCVVTALKQLSYATNVLVSDEQIKKVVSDFDALSLRLSTGLTGEDRRFGWSTEDVTTWIEILEKARADFVRDPASAGDLWLVWGSARQLDYQGTTEGELAEALYALGCALSLLGTDRIGYGLGDWPTIRATVDVWLGDEGWGVLSAPEIPGGIWTHFSHLESAGYKTLAAGQPVDVDVEDLGGPHQDGYRYRARRVVPLSPPS